MEIKILKKYNKDFISIDKKIFLKKAIYDYEIKEYHITPSITKYYLRIFLKIDGLKTPEFYIGDTNAWCNDGGQYKLINKDIEKIKSVFNKFLGVEEDYKIIESYTI